MIGSLAVGGAERQLTLLAVGLARLGLDVRVFSLEGGGPLAAMLEEAGITVIEGGYESSAPLPGKVLQLCRAQLRLIMLLLRWRPSVLHAYLPLMGLLGALGGRLCGIRRIIVAKRALGTHQDRRRYWKPVDRLVARLAHVVTANSVAVAQDAARRDGLPLDAIVVIPNGIDTDLYRKSEGRRVAVRRSLELADDDVAVVCVANLIPYKGHLDLIEAFAFVLKERPRSRLFLVGADRGLGSELLKRVVQLGIAGNVSFLGFHAEVAPILAAMDVSALASHEEGLSNALLESLASGLPVVATAVGGNQEILAGLPGCRLVPARDARAFAEGLLAVMDAVPDARARSARRTSVADGYGVATMVSRHLAVYGLEG